MSIHEAIFGPWPRQASRPVLDEASDAAVNALLQASRELLVLRHQLQGHADPLQLGIPHALNAFSAQLGDAATSLDESRHEPLRIVLMGRTQAGKSTLYEYLTRGPGVRIGDGRQRYSRDVAEQEVSGLPETVVVDTPGVGALDGRKDYTLAFEAAERADLVVWVGTTNSTQQETARALERLARSGTPMVVVVNCRMSIDDEDLLLDFLDDPSEAFADVEGNVRRLDRFFRKHGQRPVNVVPVHMQAAWRSTQLTEEWFEELRVHSRIADLEEALGREMAEQGLHRRTLRQIDRAQAPLTTVVHQIRDHNEVADEQIPRRRQALHDLHKRVGTAIDEELQRTSNAVEETIRAQRGWAERHYRDSDAEIEKAWERTKGELLANIERIVASGDEQLLDRLRDEFDDTVEDWASRLRGPADWNMDGVNGRFGNERDLSRLGVAGLEAAFPLAGAAIGLALGGPPGALLGGVLGSGVAMLAHGPLGRWARSFSTKRRESLRKQVNAQLDGLSARLAHVIDERRSKLSAYLGDHFAAQAGLLDEAAYDCAHLSAAADRLERLRQGLDQSAAVALLRIDGRDQLARSVLQAHRRPGFQMLVGISEESLAEAVLAPPRNRAERMRFYPLGPGVSTGRQVAFAAGLGTRDADVAFDTEGLVELSVTGLDPVLLVAEEQLLRSALAQTDSTSQPNQGPMEVAA